MDHPEAPGLAAYRRLEELKALINAFCEEHGYRRLFGTDGAAIDRRPQHVTAPDADRVRAILEPLGLWEQVMMVDPKKLSDLIEGRQLPPDIEDALLASREEVRTQHALYLKDPARPGADCRSSMRWQEFADAASELAGLGEELIRAKGSACLGRSGRTGLPASVL